MLEGLKIGKSGGILQHDVLFCNGSDFHSLFAIFHDLREDSIWSEDIALSGEGWLQGVLEIMRAFRKRIHVTLLSTSIMLCYVTSVMEPQMLCVCVRSGMLKQMEEDKCRFGAAAWASAAPRLEKLRFVLAKETLQHMRATEMCLSRKKEGIREKVTEKHSFFLVNNKRCSEIFAMLKA